MPVMHSHSSHVIYPILLNALWGTLLAVSVLIFIFGVGLLLRRGAMLNFIELMNKWISVRQVMNLSLLPHRSTDATPKLTALLGLMILAGATAAAFKISQLSSTSFEPLFFGQVPVAIAVWLALLVKWLLVIANAACIPLGLLMLFSPARLARLEALANTCFTIHIPALSKNDKPTAIDQLVVVYPVISGVAMVVMSLSLACLVLVRAY